MDDNLKAVAEGGRIEGFELAIEDLRCKREQLGCRRQVGNVREIVLRISNFVRVVQRRADQALAVGLKRHHPLALGKHDAPECHQGLAAHRLADHRKGLLPDRIVGGDVIGRIEEALVNVGTRHEAVDVDRVGALDLNRLQLLIFDEEELAFADLVAPGLLGAVDRFAGLLIDKLLAQPVTGTAVDLPERNPLR